LSQASIHDLYVPRLLGARQLTDRDAASTPIRRLTVIDLRPAETVILARSTRTSSLTR
jgi:hypothetical protein